MDCLNCGKELKMVEGRRPKKYCDDACRIAYFHKNKKKNEIPSKYVLKTRHEAEVEKLNAIIADLKAQISPQAQNKPMPPKTEKTPKTAIQNLTGDKTTNYSVNTEKIDQKIKEIMAEKIPHHRDTPLGRKIWAAEQEKRVAELEKLKQ